MPHSQEYWDHRQQSDHPHLLLLQVQQLPQPVVEPTPEPVVEEVVETAPEPVVEETPLAPPAPLKSERRKLRRRSKTNRSFLGQIIK